MGSVAVGVHVPSLPHYIGEFLGYWDGSGILGYRPCWCPSPLPSPSIPRYFSIHSSPAIGYRSFVFFLYGRCICANSPDPSLTHFLGEFPGFGVALHGTPRCCGPRG